MTIWDNLRRIVILIEVKKKYFTEKRCLYAIRRVDEVDITELSLHKIVANGDTKFKCYV